MTNTLNGIQLNITQSVKPKEPLMKRNKLAGSPRHKIHNLGPQNLVWTIDAWVKTEAEYNSIEALVGTTGLTFIDKFDVSYTVQIRQLSPTFKTHNLIRFKLSLEEE